MIKIPNVDDLTIKELRTIVKHYLDKGKGVKCPCCGSGLQIYKRKITANAARALLIIYSEIQKNGDKPIHIQKLFASKGLRATAMDYIQLERFELIEKAKELPVQEDLKDNGYWTITFKGKLFAQGKSSIPEHILVYNNKNYKFADKELTIFDCLKNKFDYYDLMKW